MSDSLIGQLAVLVFLLLSSFMGRWLARVARSRPGASETEGLESVKAFDYVPDAPQAARPNDTRSLVYKDEQRLVEANSPETLQSEVLANPVWVAPEEAAEELNPLRTATRSESERPILGSTASGRSKTLAGERQGPFGMGFQHPSDLRRAFKLALLLAPPRTLALDTQPDPSRFQP